MHCLPSKTFKVWFLFFYNIVMFLNRVIYLSHQRSRNHPSQSTLILVKPSILKIAVLRKWPQISTLHAALFTYILNNIDPSFFEEMPCGASKMILFRQIASDLSYGFTTSGSQCPENCWYYCHTMCYCDITIFSR